MPSSVPKGKLLGPAKDPEIDGYYGYGWIRIKVQFILLGFFYIFSLVTFRDAQKIESVHICNPKSCLDTDKTHFNTEIDINLCL